MTTNELHDLIAGDAAALECVNNGNDAGAAIRASEIAPPVAVPSWCTERTIYAALGPVAGETFLGTLEAVGENNPIVKRAVKWLAPPSEGIDLGNGATRGMLAALSDANGGPLAAASVSALLAIAERPQRITADEVSAAWKRYRSAE